VTSVARSAASLPSRDTTEHAVSSIAASGRRGYRVFLAVAIVAIVTIVVFLPVLRADFVTWDDNRNFTGNTAYRGLGLEQLRWMWTTTLMGHYVPLTWMSLGLDYVLWGMNPAGYHAVNLLLHALNAVLLFVIARALLRASNPDSGSDLIVPAAIAALVFAVHPLRVESVAWVTERRDVLSMAFYLTSVYAYLRAVGDRPRRRWFAAAVALFVCGLLSKATAVTLPAVLFLLNAFPLRRLENKPDRMAVARELIPFAALSIAAGLTSLFVLHPPAQLSIADKLGVSAYSFAFYLWKTAVPISLAALYPMPTHLDLFRWDFLLSIAVCLAYAATAGLLWRRHRGVATCMVAFVVMLLPLLGIVQNGPQIAADRYTYHAGAALALLAGAALLRWRRMPVRLLAGAIIAVWGALTWQQSNVWRSSEALWLRVLEVDSTSVVGLIAMGDVRLAQKRGPEALDYYERAMRLDTAYAQGHNNLGVLYSERGDYDRAIREHELAIHFDPRLAEAHANLGVALTRVGRDSAAIEEFKQAVALRPDLVDAEVNWGNVLVRRGDWRLAIPHYQRAIRVDGRYAQAHLNLGVALALSGDYATAVVEFERALAIDPTLRDAQSYLNEARRRAAASPPK
jgi:tetratricopeptide (TPR) repeat protein